MMESPEARRRTMQAVKSKNTSIEIRVRRLLYAQGYRYRLHKNELPGCPDLVFTRFRKIIFIHGCFWHGHRCARGKRVPKSNTDYWTAKISRNRSRDAATLEQLHELGWQTLVIWECETKNQDMLRVRLKAFLGA